VAEELAGEEGEGAVAEATAQAAQQAALGRGFEDLFRALRVEHLVVGEPLLELLEGGALVGA
jgi:hypothetical protein